jgi:putative transposase
MQKKKCSLKLYTQFLIGNHKRYSGVELSKVVGLSEMAHDAVDRWLSSAKRTPSQLWQYTCSLVDRKTGYLVGDDSLLDKRFSRKNELAKKQYSGNEHGLVNGICIVNVLWTNGEEYVPIDYRVYRREHDDLTKNDHFRNMLDTAEKRGFEPEYVLMDAWYSSIENLKHIVKKEWHFICNLKSNRLVSVEQGTYLSIADLALADRQVKQVWLKEFGPVLVCKLVATNGDITYLATNDLSLSDYDTYTSHFQHRWKIEEFHRGLKQTTGIEKCKSIKANSQRMHIFSAFVAFVKLERQRLKSGLSWYEQKALISRLSTAQYLATA